MMKHLLMIAAAGFAMSAALPADARDMWTKEQANAWYAKQPWMVGANYNNRSAINQFEMWQAATFNPKEIDEELGWASAMGMNIMRVYLHNMLWEEDAKGLKQRMETFLQIADKHKIRIMFVLFDSCWDPNPVSGPQRPPIPGVHNSGWMQAPGAARLADKSRYGELEAYVKDIVGHFANDKRIAVWDVWNEPNNEGGGGGSYKPTPQKKQLVAGLLGPVFEWARSANPSQPLTSGLWIGQNWDQMDKLDAVEKIQVTQSDVNSFHDYSWPETFEKRAKQMLSYGRPVLVTEYMARGNGSTFDGSLPLGKKYNLAMINWGFVDGKSQTRMPWDSWKKPYTYEQPTIWFHEVLRSDGKPYRQAEVDLIKRLTTEANGPRR
ncbi:endo-1,4-beta-xylanase [Sphingomonas sp. J315]|uniref:endo-1,4-beta-xylanase n=2 Tax=unclassified Sphingomonas TaxID=196159 RepID=UPI002151BFA8|nr:MULTISPECIES: endo-1,4-beta-xylanase [unclassified Sphingomonas]MCR5869393.1 cellulase family glycosylhydrolase [Sphingomonas sp. J344]UUY01477.1 cellulase family glycosylhydrolase [Sphingomonas sp. J315]